METHLLPSNRDIDKQRLAEYRDTRKSIGISKSTLAKRSKSTKLNLKKYCGNEIKDRIKRSLQLKKHIPASDHTNGDRPKSGRSASIHIPQTVAGSAHVNGNDNPIKAKPPVGTFGTFSRNLY